MSKFPVLSDFLVDGTLDINKVSERSNSSDYFLSITGSTISFRTIADVVNDLASGLSGGFVPYVGAINNLNLNSKNLTLDSGLLISNVLTGTAPFSITSTTTITNLSADLLDGFDTYHTGTTNSYIPIVYKDTNSLGGLEAGDYIDFHENWGSTDFDSRIVSVGQELYFANNSITTNHLMYHEGNLPIASTTSLGIASFDATDFTVSNGVVSLFKETDNYLNWNLQIGGVQEAAIGSGDAVNFVAGNNVSLAYSATNTVTINSSYINTQLTNAQVLGQNLTGYSIASNYYSLSATDTILGAFEKLEYRVGQNDDKNTMVFPAAGIAVSTGSGWNTSVADNSDNWNTAYSHSQTTTGNPHQIDFSDLMTTPTTLAGYGITDRASEFNSIAIIDTWHKSVLDSGGEIENIGLYEEDYVPDTAYGAAAFNNKFFTVNNGVVDLVDNLYLFNSLTVPNITSANLISTNITSNENLIVQDTDGDQLIFAIAPAGFTNPVFKVGDIDGTMAGTIYEIDFNNNIHAFTGNMTISGNASADGELTAWTASDRTLKQEIVPIVNALDMMDNINPVTFRWNSLAKELNDKKDDRINYGVIADELKPYNPELVHGLYGGAYDSVDYEQLYMIVAAAVKELKQRVETLEKTI